MITSKAFWQAALDRAIVVFAHTLAGLIGFGAISVSHVDWIPDLEISATATILSVLTSIASTRPIVAPDASPVTDPAPAANPAPVPVTQLQTDAEPASAKPTVG